MPMSICPNCNTPMNEVQRRGVFIDVCPNCRAVWLDGGELEALLAAADQGAPAAAPAPQRAAHERYKFRDDYRRATRNSDRDYDDDDDRYGGRRRKRRREGGLFDIFEELFD